MVEELAPVPEWLEGAVQAESTCWSAKEGFGKCDYNEAPWFWSPEEIADRRDDVILCPYCAKMELTSVGGFSHNVLVRNDDWDVYEFTSDPLTERLTPFAQRPARSGESCDGCATISDVTVFVPELGGWVSFDGYMSPDSNVWLAHASELSPRTLAIVQDHGIEWDESAHASTEEGSQTFRLV